MIWKEKYTKFAYDEKNGFTVTIQNLYNQEITLQKSSNLFEWVDFMKISNVMGDLKITDDNFSQKGYTFFRLVDSQSD